VRPALLVIAGPNGTGKTTVTTDFVRSAGAMGSST